jgi:hypothetical protein
MLHQGRRHPVVPDNERTLPGICAFGGTKAGIDSTVLLAYVNGINERIHVGGSFDLAVKVRWTSFKKSFDMPGREDPNAL